MSSQSSFTAPGSAEARARATGDYAADRSGWVTFAGVMLSIVGVLNIIYGIAAIDFLMLAVALVGALVAIRLPRRTAAWCTVIVTG